MLFSLAMKKLFNLMRSHLFILFFMSLALGDILVKKLLSDLIGEFGKIVGYKVNIQKSKAFLYTNNEISEMEIRKKSHFL